MFLTCIEENRCVVTDIGVKGKTYKNCYTFVTQNLDTLLIMDSLTLNMYYENIYKTKIRFSVHVGKFYCTCHWKEKLQSLKLLLFVFGKPFKGSYRSQITLQYCHPVWKIYFISYNTMYSKIFWQCLYILKLHVYEYFHSKRVLFQIQSTLFQMNRA